MGSLDLILVYSFPHNDTFRWVPALWRKGLLLDFPCWIDLELWLLSQEIINTEAQLCELGRCLQDKNSFIMPLISLSFCFLIDFDLVITLSSCQLFSAFNIFWSKILSITFSFQWENWVNNLALLCY